MMTATLLLPRRTRGRPSANTEAAYWAQRGGLSRIPIPELLRFDRELKKARRRRP
jgi:hypothetical protein